MNIVMETGRTTKAIEAKDAGNTRVANFTIAVDRGVKREGQPDVDFFNCTAFGKTADAMAQNIAKGSRILVVGSLQNDTYTDKDGKQRTSTKIMVNRWEYAGPKPNGDADATTQDDDDDALPFA